MSTIFLTKEAVEKKHLEKIRLEMAGRERRVPLKYDIFRPQLTSKMEVEGDKDDSFHTCSEELHQKEQEKTVGLGPHMTPVPPNEDSTDSDSDDGDSDETEAPKSTKRKRRRIGACFLGRNCQHGVDCRFRHSEEERQLFREEDRHYKPSNKKYLLELKCKDGSICRFRRNPEVTVTSEEEEEEKKEEIHKPQSTCLNRD